MGLSGNGTALVLSGGGARGAYQAGVLYGLLERGLVAPGPSPFPILVGTSAGSIHATALAAWADRFEHAVTELYEVWSVLQAHHVFRSDLGSLLLTAFRWARDLGFGGLLGGVTPKSMLDTSPLPRLFSKIPFHQIGHRIAAGHLTALAVPATEYFSNESVIFLEGRDDLQGWKKKRARVEKTRIGINHIMASSAIPMIFPTVRLDGTHFGDGCLRNTTPLGPAIRLGADRILAVGVHEPAGVADSRTPMVADVASTILDAIMMDAMEKDVAHCQRINKNLRESSPDFRKVDVLWLAPSQPIAPLARKMMNRIPLPVRYLLHGLGGDRASAELASYLLFHPDFCGTLIDLGRADVAAREEEIARFLGVRSEQHTPPAEAHQKPLQNL
ncbi:MAG: patatin-like phospholipase family protein [Vulcanimicrobiota bacterium]